MPDDNPAANPDDNQEDNPRWQPWWQRERSPKWQPQMTMMVLTLDDNDGALSEKYR
jgi:hypothetical protein